VRAAPAVSQACCKEICCPRAYRFSGEHSGLPHATALRLIRVRPGDRLSCHHRLLQLSPPPTWRQHRDVRPTRLHRTLTPRSSVAASASIASHRTVVTIAIAPLVAVDGRIEHLIWVADKAEYFQFAGLTTFLKIRS